MEYSGFPVRRLRKESLETGERGRKSQQGESWKGDPPPNSMHELT